MQSKTKGAYENTQVQPRQALPPGATMHAGGGNSSGNGVRVAWTCCALCCLALVAILVVAVGLAALEEDEEFVLGDEDILLPDTSTELRDGNNYVGVLFAVDPPSAALDAFVSASNKWSNIVAGTQLDNGLNIPRGFACGNFIISNDFFLDHLLITAFVGPIDGRGGVLAAAGPCQAQNGRVSDLPIMGQMIFDSDDIGELIADGTFEAVILHEMGHVLGIGTLWLQSVQGSINLNINSLRNDNLLQDPVINIFNGVVNSNNSPKFIGDNGILGFQQVGGGLDFVPVEDGVVPGRQPFNNANGAGSVDGHWDIEVFNNELMVFAIDADNDEFPLSVMTVRSLQDLGYTVDVTEADPFTLPTFSKSINLDGPHVHVLVNDILS